MPSYVENAVLNEKAKLRELNEKEKQEGDKTRHDWLIANMTVMSILTMIAQTIIDIINDLVEYDWSSISIREIILIFVKGDRMLYLGIGLLLFSFIVKLTD